jgi:hypothetical protein
MVILVLYAMQRVRREAETGAACFSLFHQQEEESGQHACDDKGNE